MNSTALTKHHLQRLYEDCEDVENTEVYLASDVDAYLERIATPDPPDETEVFEEIDWKLYGF